MKGRPLEELDEIFQNRVSVRAFPKYECVSSQVAREIASERPENGNVGTRSGKEGVNVTCVEEVG